MESAANTIKQDLNVARQYFRLKNFESLGEIGNRIMSNLFLGEEKHLMIVGYLVKEVAQEFIEIRSEDPVRLNGCMDAGEKFLRDISNSLSDDLDPITVWEHYHQYKNKIVEFIPTDVELLVYRKDVEFTSHTTQKLMKLLDENRSLLLDSYNNLLYNILGEQKRVINIYGFTKTDLIRYISLKAFYEYYLYLMSFKMVNKLEGEAIANNVYQYVDRISQLPTEFQEMAVKSSEILGELGYKTTMFQLENVDPRKTIKSIRGF